MTPRESGKRGESGKQRTSRIPLDYYKTADGLSRGKRWLSLAAAVAAGVWLSGVGWDVRSWPRRSEASRALASHGTLARAHASLDHDCDSCHVPFSPIDGSSWAAKVVHRDGGGDAKCAACHNPPGHNPTASDRQESCARCHRDHRGRESSLVALDDADCTRCHAALAGHVKPGRAPAFAAAVTRFDRDPKHHPEFALFRSGRPPTDPGKIKFNHALHMTRGLNPTAGGRPLLTLADLDAEARARYPQPKGAGEADGVQLECASCHRPEGDRTGGGGALMAPVRFESDCKACHPLTFERGLPPVRHGLQPDEVDAALWQAFSARFLQGHPDLPDRWQPAPRSIPGHDEPAEARAARAAVADEVAKAEGRLFGGQKCGECHHYETPKGRAVEGPTAWDPDRPFRVAAADVPGVWFRHARFDHEAHAAVGCRSCHERAYPDARGASRESGDVLMPSAAACQTCHAPKQGSGASATGGAGFGCTECHRYHGGEMAPPGRGGGLETALKQFLRGTPRGGGG